MWWRSAVNRSFFLCLAACRMRSSACDHAFPVLRPARALLARIPLGPRPSLHRLRSGSPGLVRRLHSYYGGVRLLAPVHHRLRLLAFPMRTGVASPLRPDAGPPRFRRVPFARDVVFDPGRATAPRIAALHMLPSTDYDGLRPCDIEHFVAQSHTPRNRCVRFVAGVAAGSRNTRYQAARYGLTRAGLPPAGSRQLPGAPFLTLSRDAGDGRWVAFRS